MTRYVSKVEATDCCQTCEPAFYRGREGELKESVSIRELRAEAFSAQLMQYPGRLKSTGFLKGNVMADQCISVKP